MIHPGLYPELERKTRADFQRGIMMTEFLEDRVGDLTDLFVLDLGGGKGGTSLALASRGATVVCVDVSTGNISDARLVATGHLTNGKFSLVRAAAENLPFAPETFQLVILNGVLEWIG